MPGTASLKMTFLEANHEVEGFSEALDSISNAISGDDAEDSELSDLKELALTLSNRARSTYETPN